MSLVRTRLYVSKTMNAAQRKYSTTKKELLALLFALEEFRPLILQYEVHVFTDHKPLLGVVQKPTKDSCVQRWTMLIQEYNIKLFYLEGKHNIFADPLSRLSDITKESKDLNDLTEEFDDKLNQRLEHVKVLHSYLPVKVKWSEKQLRRAQAADPFCTTLKEHLREPAQNKDEYSKSMSKLLLRTKILKGIIYIVREIKRGTLTDEFLVPYVPDSLMKDAFELMHNESTSGHKGYHRTLRLFVKNFYNIKERSFIKKSCAECDLCIRAKGSPKLIPIRKYPIPPIPFTVITMDILGPLRATEDNKQYILCVRDFTTRYTVLYPLDYKSTDNVIIALRNFMSHYGSPEVLLSDNACEFTSETLLKFCEFYNIKKVQVAPYHPASQGLAERINKEVNSMIRIYSSQLAMEDWDQLLPIIQLTLNNTFNASLQETPFFSLYGYDSRTVTYSSPKVNYSEDNSTQHLKRVTTIRDYCLKTTLNNTR